MCTHLNIDLSVNFRFVRKIMLSFEYLDFIVLMPHLRRQTIPHEKNWPVSLLFHPCFQIFIWQERNILLLL